MAPEIPKLPVALGQENDDEGKQFSGSIVEELLEPLAESVEVLGKTVVDSVAIVVGSVKGIEEPVFCTVVDMAKEESVPAAVELIVEEPAVVESALVDNGPTVGNLINK